MDEMQRILNQGKSHFVLELKDHWGGFCEKAQFYGVFKKVMGPPSSNKGNYRPHKVDDHVCLMSYFVF